MERTEIFKFLKAQIASQGGFETDTMTEQSNLYSDLGLDSLDAVELVMECEKEYHINVPDATAEKLSTIAEVIDTVIILIDKKPKK